MAEESGVTLTNSLAEHSSTLFPPEKDESLSKNFQSRGKGSVENFTLQVPSPPLGPSYSHPYAPSPPMPGPGIGTPSYSEHLSSSQPPTLPRASGVSVPGGEMPPQWPPFFNQGHGASDAQGNLTNSFISNVDSVTGSTPNVPNAMLTNAMTYAGAAYAAAMMAAANPYLN